MNRVYTIKYHNVVIFFSKNLTYIILYKIVHVNPHKNKLSDFVVVCSEKKMVMFCKGNLINVLYGSYLKKKDTTSFVSCRKDTVLNL